MPLVYFEQHDQLGEIVFDNPPRNQFSVDALGDLGVALKEAAASDVRAILLRAEGNDFSFGADPSVFNGLEEDAAPGFAAAVMGLTAAVEDIPVPTLALIQGQCWDGALEMCLACDLIWAAAGSQIAQMEAQAGGMPYAGGTQRLASRIGVARAAEMVFTGAVMSAETLLSWGLVNRVVPADRLLEDGRAFAQRLANGPTVAHKAVKRVLHAWRSGGVAEADRVNVAEAPTVMLSDDLANGVASLKRDGLGHATFQGR